MAKSKSKIVNIDCHICKRETKHKMICSRAKSGKITDDWGDVDFWWSVDSEVYQCGGCEELTIKRFAQDSEAEPDLDYFPSRPSRLSRTMPDWVRLFSNDKFSSLLTEIYKAMEIHSYRLVAMGLRALLDEVMNDKIGDIGGFDQKLEEMVKQGLLSKVQREVLEPTIELGHAAIHRGHQPSYIQIDGAFGVVESLLHLYYVQSETAESLKSSVTPRAKQEKKKQEKPPEGK